MRNRPGRRYIRGMSKLDMYGKAARKAFLGKPKPGRATLTLATVAFLITALMAIWPVTNSYGTDCGMWLENNTSKAAYEDAKQNSKLADLDLRDSLLATGGDLNGKSHTASRGRTTDQVDSCISRHDARTPLLTFVGIVTLALLVVGVIRRYQPSGGRAAETAQPPTD